MTKVEIMAATLKMMNPIAWQVQETKSSWEQISSLEDQVARQFSRMETERPWVIQRIERWPMGTWTTGFVLGCADGIQIRSSLPSEITMIFSQNKWCTECCLKEHPNDQSCSLLQDEMGVESEETERIYENCENEEHVVYLATLGNRMWVGMTCVGTAWNPWFLHQRLVEEGADLVVVFQHEEELLLNEALELQSLLARELGVPTKLTPQAQLKALMEHPHSLKPELSALSDHVTWAHPELNVWFMRDYSEEGMDSKYLNRLDLAKIIRNDPELMISMNSSQIKTLVGTVEVIKGNWMLLTVDGWQRLIWLPGLIGKGILDTELG